MVQAPSGSRTLRDDLYFKTDEAITRDDNDGFLPVGESLDAGATLYLLSESDTRVVEISPNA